MNNEVNPLLQYYSELTNGNVTNALQEIKKHADRGNSFAIYILASFCMFGKPPRFYDFNKVYEAGIVKQNAEIAINEIQAFHLYVSLLKLNETKINNYRLKAIFDLYKILDGRSEFFKNNDIDLRPRNGEQTRLSPLFDGKDKIKQLLLNSNYFEIYLDHALDKISEFEKNNSKNSLEEAVEYLNKITASNEFNLFSRHDVSEAHYQLAKLALSGNDYVGIQPEVGVRNVELSSSDKAYVLLLNYYKRFGDKYIKSIRKCIALIKNESLQEKLMIENNLELREKTDINSVLENIHALSKINNTSISNSFVKNDVSEEDKMKERLALEAAQKAEQEIVNSIDLDYLNSSDLEPENHDEDAMLDENHDNLFNEQDDLLDDDFEIPEKFYAEMPELDD